MPIPTAEKIWMDGEFVAWDDAKIHVLTPTLHYGWGVFEGIRAYATGRGPAVFQLRPHIERLFRSAKIYPPLDEIPFTVDEVCDATVETIRVNGLQGAYLRPLAWLGLGELGTNPMGHPVEMMVGAFEWGAYLGEEALEKGVRVMVSSYRRIGKNTIPPASKTNGQYINSSLAKVEALRAGYDEAIMLSEDGYLAEGTGENIFVIRDGAIHTPPLSDGPLGGITRTSVMTIARDLGYEVHETSLVRTDLFLADEAFLTGTAAELTPIAEIEGRKIGEGKRGPITEKVQATFMDTVQGKVSQYDHWLTYVND